MSAYYCTDCKETGKLDVFDLCAFCGSDNVRDAECSGWIFEDYTEEGFDGCLDDFDERGCEDYHRSIEPEFKEE